MDCPVCYVKLTKCNSYIFPCTHMSCNQCYIQLINKVCPLCREPVQVHSGSEPIHILSQSAPTTEYDYLIVRERRRKKKKKKKKKGRERKYDKDSPVYSFHIDDDNLLFQMDDA